MNQGFMIVAELTMCHVSEDLAAPVPAEGYMVSFVVFHEQGFGVPLHRFLRSLLQHYHQELHNLTPLWILHIAAFLSLCEAYLRMDPSFRPVELFLPCSASAGPRCETDNFRGGVVIHVKSCHGINPYFYIPLPRLMKGW
jgi:hypothetical protein